jgi:hypothetical protein
MKTKKKWGLDMKNVSMIKQKTICFFFIFLIIANAFSINVDASFITNNYCTTMNLKNKNKVSDSIFDKGSNSKTNSGNGTYLVLEAYGLIGVTIRFIVRGGPAYNVSFHEIFKAGIVNKINITYTRTWGECHQDYFFEYTQIIAAILTPILVQVSITADNAPPITKNLHGLVIMFFVVMPRIFESP